MKKMDYCIKNNYVDKILFNADDLRMSFYGEKEKYLEYREGKIDVSDWNMKLKFRILTFLEEMGFSLQRLGTFYYKDVIFKLIKILDWLDNKGYNFLVKQMEKDKIIDKEIVVGEILIQCINDLRKELVNPYSQFYFDIARNDNFIGTKTFHSYIQNSFDKLDSEKEKYDFLVSLSIVNGRQLNYGELAFSLASYIKNNGFEMKVSDLERGDNHKTKVRN